MNAYRMPTTGFWESGRFLAFVERIDGHPSGVVIDRTATHSDQAKKEAVESACCVDDLLKIPGAIRSAEFFDRER